MSLFEMSKQKIIPENENEDDADTMDGKCVWIVEKADIHDLFISWDLLLLHNILVFS